MHGNGIGFGFALLGIIGVYTGCIADASPLEDAHGEDVASEESELRRRPAFCGGIAGFACPRPGQTCVDDPCDDCDPAQGGADCGGICVNARRAPACEGIAGLVCPRRLTCVDDPRDDCVPGQGADCGGLCVSPRCPRVR